MRINEYGAGPAVLLLHGTPSTSAHFQPLADALATSHRVLVPDLPGYNGVPALPPGDRLARTTALLEDALVSRGIEKVQVIGFSGGAYRALLLAGSSRVKVTGLVLLGGFANAPQPLRQGWRELAGALRAGAELRHLLSGMVSLAFAEKHPETVEEVKGWVDAVAPADLADELDDLAAGPDLRETVAALAIPLLVRVGELDQSAPVPLSEEIARLNPRARLEIVLGAGHALLAENAGPTIAAIRAALR